MRAFDDLVRQGKVLYAGVSDCPAWWIARANTVAELRGWSPFAALQIEYSLLERTPERELLPMSRAVGLTVTAWSPLANGLLSGKYRVTPEGVQSQAGGGRMDNPDMQQFVQDPERTNRVIETLVSVSKEVGRSAAEVALAWLRHRPDPVIPIVGARRLEQLEANLSILDIRLTEQQLQRLDKASHVDLGFPYDFFSKPMVRGLTHAGTGDLIDGLGERISA